MAEENEFSRMKEYRKLRAGGKSDMAAREEVWPSTRAGMKKNADGKARVEKMKRRRLKNNKKKKRGSACDFVGRAHLSGDHHRACGDRNLGRWHSPRRG